MNNQASFSQHLRDSFASTWDAAIGHRFVDELFAGTIDDRVLAGYLVQDYQFFDPFLRLLGEAICLAPETVTRVRLGKQMGMLVNDEDSYFVKSFDALGVGEKDRTSPTLTDATNTMFGLMTEAIASHSWIKVLTPLLVFEWLYLDWAEDPRHKTLPKRPEHLGWIDLHRGDDFRNWVAFLRAEFDAAKPESATEQATCTNLFSRTVTAELAFFDAAYR